MLSMIVCAPVCRAGGASQESLPLGGLTHAEMLLLLLYIVDKDVGLCQSGDTGQGSVPSILSNVQDRKTVCVWMGVFVHTVQLR